MAERRMFAKTIIDSDAFLDMPATTQMLYFHLSMRADDDGFVNNPKRIQRMVGASDDDAKILLAKRFIIAFESGVIVIKHWRINNYIQSDRRKPTLYEQEMGMLTVKPDGSYTECIQNGYKLDTQDSIGKDSIGKDNNKEERHKYGQYNNVLLSDADLAKLKEEFPSDWTVRIERLSEYIVSSGKSYKSHLATIRSWARKDEEKQAEKRSAAANFSQRDTDYDALLRAEDKWNI